MTKLEKLYQSIEGLKELGLPLNEETLKAVDNLEEELIKNEVIPRLTGSIEPIITQIQRPIVLVVDYVPGKTLSVRLTRKKVITDEHETKKYELMFSPQTKEIPVEKKGNFKTRGKWTKLAVTFSDGTIIEREFAYETLLAVIEKVGPDKVSTLGFIRSGFPVVTQQLNKAFRQHKIKGGWYVITHSSTDDKKRLIESISKKLGLGLKVEVV